MSIPESAIYGGVQALPRSAKTHKNTDVQTQGTVNDGNVASHAIRLCVNFGYAFYVERLLKLSRTVKWISTREHFIGLREYLIQVPVELADRTMLDKCEFGYLEAVSTSDPSAAEKETLYLLAAHRDFTLQPGEAYNAICIAAVCEVAGRSTAFYPSIQDSLFAVVP